MLNNPPVFEVYYPTPDSQFVIKKSTEFHNRVLEFIELRLSDNFASNDPDDNILCFFRVEDDEASHLEARLELEGYKKSLETCLTYFTDEEEYEKCKQIKNLQQKLNNIIS